MTDKHLSVRDKLQHENYNSRDKYCKGLDLHNRSLGGEDGNKENVAAPEVNQRGADVMLTPFQPEAAAVMIPVWVKEGPVRLFEGPQE
jgi:hypothetical protein